MGYVQLTEVRRYGHYMRGVLRSRNRTGRHFRPQDDWWNATETVDLSLGAINAPPPSPLLEQKQRRGSNTRIVNVYVFHWYRVRRTLGI